MNSKPNLILKISLTWY